MFKNGRLSYIQIPAEDVKTSAAFYESVFGWNLRGGSDDHFSFDDATGDMIGAWVTGRVPSSDPGVLPYISVDDVDATIETITANGGQVVRPKYSEGKLLVATFRDPGGNVIGIWNQPQ